MIARELLREAVRLGVDQEIDVALAVQRHVLRAMARGGAKAHLLEQRAQRIGVGRRVFDEFEAVGAHRIAAVVHRGSLI